MLLASREGLGTAESGDAAHPAARQTGAEEVADEEHLRQRKSAPDSGQEELFARKTLAPRKKEFLKRKKLKRKGKLLSEAGEGEGTDVEAEVMRDLHKPAFGEQAMQPIKVCSLREFAMMAGQAKMHIHWQQ